MVDSTVIAQFAISWSLSLTELIWFLAIVARIRRGALTQSAPIRTSEERGVPTCTTTAFFKRLPLQAMIGLVPPAAKRSVLP